MGLLEKAEKIQSDEDEEIPSDESPATAVVPEPVQKKEKPAKKSRSRRDRSKKGKKAKKAKKERVPKVIPDGFEKAGKSRSAARYLVDLIANFGLISLFVAWFIWTNEDITTPLIFSIVLALGNIYYLPSKFSRSSGNIVSGTKFVNTRGDTPSFLYHVGKSANVPLVFLGFGAMMIAISAGTDWDSPGTKVFVGASLIMMILPLIDRMMYRMRDDDLGLWDTLFGGVWLVTASNEKSESGIIQRLQSIGEYAEQRGMLTEEDGNTE